MKKGLTAINYNQNKNFTLLSAGIIKVIAPEHNHSPKLGTIAHKNAVSFSGTISFMIVKYPLTMNGESRNVRVAGTDQVLSPAEILSGVRVLRVSDDETSRVGEADSLGGGWI